LRLETTRPGAQGTSPAGPERAGLGLGLEGWGGLGCRAVQWNPSRGRHAGHALPAAGRRLAQAIRGAGVRGHVGTRGADDTPTHREPQQAAFGACSGPASPRIPCIGSMFSTSHLCLFPVGIHCPVSRDSRRPSPSCAPAARTLSISRRPQRPSSMDGGVGQPPGPKVTVRGLFRKPGHIRTPGVLHCPVGFGLRCLDFRQHQGATGSQK
jgi:hypothetical protein